MVAVQVLFMIGLQDPFRSLSALVSLMTDSVER
jgi:hypothetical protein